MYTIPLGYREFIDHEIKQLEEARIISRSWSDWESAIPVVPKKEELAENPSGQSTASPINNKFNLTFCINFRKINSHLMTASQIKADGSLGKAISNYPTTNNRQHFA